MFVYIFQFAQLRLRANGFRAILNHLRVRICTHKPTCADISPNFLTNSNISCILWLLVAPHCSFLVSLFYRIYFLTKSPKFTLFHCIFFVALFFYVFLTSDQIFCILCCLSSFFYNFCFTVLIFFAAFYFALRSSHQSHIFLFLSSFSTHIFFWYSL